MSLVAKLRCARCHQLRVILYAGNVCAHCSEYGYWNIVEQVRDTPENTERRIRYYRERASKGLPLFTDIRGRECG